MQLVDNSLDWDTTQVREKFNFPLKLKLPTSYTEVRWNLQTQNHRFHQQAIWMFQISAKPVNGWKNLENMNLWNQFLFQLFLVVKQIQLMFLSEFQNCLCRMVDMHIEMTLEN